MENYATLVNRKAFELFGYTQDDFNKGFNALNLISPADRQRAAENIERALKGENLGLNDYTLLRRDGTSFPAMIHSTIIRDRGKPTGIRGFIIDVS